MPPNSTTNPDISRDDRDVVNGTDKADYVSTDITKTAHYERVEQFCLLAGHAAPGVPTNPTPATAELRAKIIMEEVLETIEALGVTVSFIPGMTPLNTLDMKNLSFVATHEPDLVGIADGCADIAVVTTGTLVACGIPDNELLVMVDENNLQKFGPGHSINEYGKLVKPPGHKPPDINGWLSELIVKQE